MTIDRNALIGALSSNRYLPAEQAEGVADLILGKRQGPPHLQPDVLLDRAQTAEADLADLRARVAAVREVHVRCADHCTCADSDDFCHECGQMSPCLTIRTLDGSTAEPTDPAPPPPSGDYECCASGSCEVCCPGSGWAR